MAVKKQDNWLPVTATRIIRVHFFFAFAYALNIIVSDSWNLIPPEALKQRWNIAAAMLVVTALLWYVARNITKRPQYYQYLIYVLILMDIAIASITVYAQRGMSSRAVALFAVPIAVSSALMSRTALYATATLCTAGYALAAIRYFIANPSEGYKVELYGEVSFYCLVFFILAAILSAVVRRARQP